MKKNLLLTTILFTIINVFAQQLIDFDIENKCSRAKFYTDYFLKSKDIIQTPLLHDYDVKFYFLDLNVENNTIYISGNVTFNAQVVATQLDTFAFELVDELTIDSVKINGLNQGFSHINNEVFVALTNPLPEYSDFSALIFYHGTPPTGGFFSGISTAYDSTWSKNVTWTLSEPFNARQWWPVKQVLTDKADSVWVFLTTGNTNKAGSIGLLTAETPMPNNKVRYEWKSKYPIDYYLISFAVSEYQEYNIYAKPSDLQGDSILIQNYIYDSPDCLSYYKEGIDNTIDFIELFSDLYSLYPFYEEKYGHCLVDIGGGMEHQTMTTIGGFGFGLVSHELGHMWFGDNVTCATWSDIWVNEGFATYSDYLAHEYIAGDDWPHIWMEQAHNYVKSEPDGSIYIPPEEITYDNVWRIFNGRLSYYKGALIIHMIRFELQDDDLFFQVLHDFQYQFGDSVATGIDFMNVLNETSGMDFAEFFNQWYFGEGYPIYYISWVQQNNSLELNSSQISSVPHITPFFKMHVPYKLFFSDGTDSTIILYQSDHDMEFSLPFEKIIDSIQVDPKLWVLKKVAYLNNINENNNPVNFSFSPNPANDKLNLLFANNDQKERHVLIFDLSGSQVLSVTTAEDRISLDISGLPSSTYFIKVTDGSNQLSKKFIKLN